MMTKLYLIRDRIKRFCLKNQAFILPVVKFIVGIFLMYIFSSNLSYMSTVNQWWVVLGVAAVCAFLPWSGIAVTVNAYILINFYAVSWEVMAVMGFVYLMMLIVYYVFQPKYGVVFLLMPIFLWARLPFVPAVVVAVLGTTAGLIPMVCGTIVYYIVLIVKDNASVLALSENMNMTQKFSFMLSRILGSKNMWLMCLALVITLCIVYVVRTRRANYSREISVVAGTVAGIVVYLAGSVYLNIQINGLVLVYTAVMSVLVGIITVLSKVTLDYSSVEYVQFEDDEYYYYVKAVPKVKVTEPEFTVKRFENADEEESDLKSSLENKETVTEDSKQG